MTREWLRKDPNLLGTIIVLGGQHRLHHQHLHRLHLQHRLHHLLLHQDRVTAITMRTQTRKALSSLRKGLARQLWTVARGVKHIQGAKWLLTSTDGVIIKS